MKLTLIGGAGVRAVFFAEHLSARCAELGIDEFTLMDTDERKLEIIGALCSYVIEKNNAELKVVLTTDPVEAVKRARWIVTTIRAGAERSRAVDERIALKYGVIGQETTGPGGFSMALRSIGALEEYCRLASAYAPGAWIFNFTNPSGLVTQALRQKGFDRVIGICDTPGSTRLRMADALGLPPESLYVEFFGLNHLSWISSVVHEDRELLPGLVKNAEFLGKVEEFSIFDPSLIALLNYLPNEYLYYYYHREKALANILASPLTRGEAVERNSREMLEKLGEVAIGKNPEKAMEIYLHYCGIRESSYMSVEANLRKGGKDDKRPEKGAGLQGYAGVAFDFIEAVSGRKKDSHLVLSVPNNGSIDGLNDDDVVEVTCRIDKDGPAPVKIGGVSEHAACLMKSVKLYERKTVEAFYSKSRPLAIEALMAHPLVCSYSLAKSIAGDIFDAYRDILGDWR